MFGNYDSFSDDDEFCNGDGLCNDNGYFRHEERLASHLYTSKLQVAPGLDFSWEKVGLDEAVPSSHLGRRRFSWESLLLLGKMKLVGNSHLSD